MALTKPKLAIKDNINALDSKSNSSFPKMGMTVCSSPIIEPTKALTTINKRNWLMLGFKPSLIKSVSLLGMFLSLSSLLSLNIFYDKLIGKLSYFLFIFYIKNKQYEKIYSIRNLFLTNGKLSWGQSILNKINTVLEELEIIIFPFMSYF